jgi:hypothetical protein
MKSTLDHSAHLTNRTEPDAVKARRISTPVSLPLDCAASWVSDRLRVSSADRSPSVHSVVCHDRCRIRTKLSAEAEPERDHSDMARIIIVAASIANELRSIATVGHEAPRVGRPRISRGDRQLSCGIGYHCRHRFHSRSRRRRRHCGSRCTPRFEYSCGRRGH